MRICVPLKTYLLLRILVEKTKILFYVHPYNVVTKLIYICICVFAVRCMMYGFGDDKNPYTESVDLLEDLVIQFIKEMVSNSLFLTSFSFAHLGIMKMSYC